MRRLTTVLFIALVLASCVTPVIPLPPPENVYLKELDQTLKQVVVAGPASGPHGDALFYVLNQRTGRGTITQGEPDGSFVSAPLEADDGDRLGIWAARFSEDAASSVLCEVVDYKQKALVDCP